MAALIVRIIGILVAASGGILMHAAVTGGRGVEMILLLALVMLLGAAMVVISILAPRWRERTDTVENCLGYRLRVDSQGEIINTCPRDTAEAALYRGEMTFDEYAAEIPRYEYDVRGESRRAALARAHNAAELLTSEYADELEALAGEVSALRDAYAAGEITGDEYEARLQALVG